MSFSWFAGGGEAISEQSVVVQAVPEPLTFLGAGAAVAIGAFFRRAKTNKPQKQA